MDATTENEFEPCILLEYEEEFGLLFTINGVFEEKVEIFREMGFSGSGNNWCGVVDILVRINAPEFNEKLDYDSEFDLFTVASQDIEALREVARLIRGVIEDNNLLKIAIKKADPNMML
jgi:Immunity protein 51